MVVIGAFPAAKLSVLLIKQISKPIANLCKERAKNHPFFRKYVCMPPAQFYNWCEVKAKMWILNLGKPVNIPVLSQDMAIELGANLLGEAVIFMIGATILTFEYNRQSNKEAAKEEKRRQELDDISETIRDLYFTVQQQQTQLKELERIVLNLPNAKNVKIPDATNPQAPREEGPPPTDTKPHKQPTTFTPTKTETISNEPQYTIYSNTPYPDRGIVLKALNYIQMDILNTSIYKIEKSEEPKNFSQRRRESILSKALNNIENEHRSLF